MPLYDFRCRQCHTRFEALCRDTRADGVRCPSCQAAVPDRLISTFAVSRNLTPCGTPASEKAPGCGFNPGIGGCGHCGH